ncbi:unnamed protein product, partial [Amoebophrya sp. A25]
FYQFLAECREWELNLREAVLREETSSDAAVGQLHEDNRKITVRSTKDWFDPQSCAYVPGLICSSAWAFLVPLNPIPSAALGLSLHPLVKRLVHSFTLRP